MRNPVHVLFGSVALALLLAGTTAATLVPEHAVDNVAVRDVAARGDVVTGVVVNNTGNEIRDVQLLVRRAFLWSNERNPGTDNPSRAEVFAFPATIPAGGSATFEHRIAVPERDDGSFRTEIQVLGFTEIGGSATSSHR